jgi:hypothetical protein
MLRWIFFRHHNTSHIVRVYYVYEKVKKSLFNGSSSDSMWQTYKKRYDLYIRSEEISVVKYSAVSPLKINRRFGETYSGSKNKPSKRSVQAEPNLTTRHYIRGERTLHKDRCKILKSCCYQCLLLVSSQELKKLFLYRPWWPIGLWDVEVPKHFLDNRLTDGGEVVSLTRRPPFTPQENSWY